MIHCIYRLYAGENTRERPAWYSKKLCFYSLWGSVDIRVFLNHGDVDWLPDGINVTKVDIEDINDSCRLVLHEALQFPDSDWIYFCEDDYLHIPGAIKKLQHCIEDVKPDIVSLYDHPDRYIDLPEHNFTNGKNDIYVSRDHHWRTIPSTCMTFGISVKALRENADIFEEWGYLDYEIWEHLLGFKGERPNKYLMVGAIPSLATHAEEGFLSPVREWSIYA